MFACIILRTVFCKPGECMKSCTGYLTSAVLVGLLSNEIDGSPNLINILSLAKETGIMVWNPLVQMHNRDLFCCLQMTLSELLLQVNQSHCDSAEAPGGVCKVEIATSGCSFKASGSVQGGVPVLLELNDSAFRQPISLRGNLLFLQASANPQLLSSVAGKDISITASKINPLFHKLDFSQEGGQYSQL